MPKGPCKSMPLALGPALSHPSAPIHRHRRLGQQFAYNGSKTSRLRLFSARPGRRRRRPNTADRQRLRIPGFSSSSTTSLPSRHIFAPRPSSDPLTHSWTILESRRTVHLGVHQTVSPVRRRLRAVGRTRRPVRTIEHGSGRIRGANAFAIDRSKASKGCGGIFWTHRRC